MFLARVLGGKQRLRGVRWLAQSGTASQWPGRTPHEGPSLGLLLTGVHPEPRAQRLHTREASRTYMFETWVCIW